MTDAPFRCTGKEVLRGSEHYADCISEGAAELVTVALNALHRTAAWAGTEEPVSPLTPKPWDGVTGPYRDVSNV